MSKPVLEDLFSFSVRRNRKSYFLVGLSMTLILAVLGGFAFMGSSNDGGWGGFLIVGLISLPMLVSGLAVQTQRCRDFGWTGWAVLLSFIPYIGWIFAVALLFIPGTQGPNRYGPDPLAPQFPPRAAF